MAQIRMYTQKGCPHCETARQFLESKNVTVESIEVGFDPILQSGLRSAFNGGSFQVPVIISFITQEVNVGNDPVQLQRIVDSISAVTPNTPAQ